MGIVGADLGCIDIHLHLSARIRTSDRNSAVLTTLERHSLIVADMGGLVLVVADDIPATIRDFLLQRIELAAIDGFLGISTELAIGHTSDRMTAIVQTVLLQNNIGSGIIRFCIGIMDANLRRMLRQAVAILVGYLQALASQNCCIILLILCCDTCHILKIFIQSIGEIRTILRQAQIASCIKCDCRTSTYFLRIPSRISCLDSPISTVDGIFDCTCCRQTITIRCKLTIRSNRQCIRHCIHSKRCIASRTVN